MAGPAIRAVIGTKRSLATEPARPRPQSSFIAKANIEMTDNRRQRADSAATAVQAAQNAALGPREPLPYAPVPDAVLPFWEAVMRNRPRDRWNDLDLANAAVLSWAQYDVARLNAEIASEGDIIDGKLNPKHALLDKLARRIMSLSRLLHVHPEATEGRARESGKSLEAEREAEGQHSRLIPTLRAVT